MKKLFAIIAVVAFAASFTACKKDYTCSCTLNGNTSEFPYSKVKKSEAEDACDAQNAQFSSQGGSCELK